MTLGEKLKEARKQAGLSQEQLAEKLNVSRSAVAKWETDKGIPDIDNLKAISQLLTVSIDYLVDNGSDLDKAVIREAVDLEKYGKMSKGKKKDMAVREKYPDAEITPLTAEKKVTKREHIIGDIIGIFTDAPFGVPEMLNAVKDMDKAYYLAEQDDKQFLVLVTDEFMESRELVKRQNGRKFEIGDMTFKRMKCLKNMP